MEYDIISWESINEAVEILAKQIEDSNIHYEVIYGLARGGLVPAVMLSHKLKIPMVLNMEEVWRLKVKNKPALIVDDISDTGETLRYFDDQKFDIAALFVRVHTSKIKPKYSYKNINHNNWLLFPWETKDSSK
ncbi:phosphoribosyltransferase [uncultured Brachyspira sp.]|uniref:phosphoribosyltransferase n=1 Tax=uncultured Brachyspira sp. TaxID=221953 RepID=UPI0025FD8D61|nr:phosphoribosyltransferase family protein [uncultured Brachyspira sp.]